LGVSFWSSYTVMDAKIETLQQENKAYKETNIKAAADLKTQKEALDTLINIINDNKQIGNKALEAAEKLYKLTATKVQELSEQKSTGDFTLDCKLFEENMNRELR